MKKLITAIVCISLLLITVFMLSSCNPQEPTFHTLKYTAGEGGIIDGEAEQTVERRQNGNTVTAVPNDGYEFVKWSDNVTTASRQDKRVKRNIDVTAIFQKQHGKSYTITYLVEEGGTLEGETIQTLSNDSETTNSVSVKVRDGYEFLGWSDGHDISWRSDSYYNIDTYYKEDTTFTARIRRIDGYKLMNWYTKFGIGVPTVTINKDTVDTLSFPVPTREHFTFNGWYLGDTLVGDEQGNSLFTKDMLEDGNRDIVAKWTANETFTYKILLVYVTRINATLPTVDNTTTIHVDYTMSALEREFYHLTTIRLEEYLEHIMDGLVDFQVDEYYTTQTVVTQDFKQGSSAVGHKLTNSLSVEQIPETSERIKNYDSALSVYSLNVGNRSLVDVNGMAGLRYGEIYADAFLRYGNLDKHIATLKSNEYNWLEQDQINTLWLDVISHELAHTIEQRINLYSYHDTINGMQTLTQQYREKMYYLNEIETDGKRVGIPYDFWKGEISTAIYYVSRGQYGSQGFIASTDHHVGSIIAVGQGNMQYDVVRGRSISVKAVPIKGYRFVSWSDGVTTAERTDIIIENLEVTALFEKIE